MLEKVASCDPDPIERCADLDAVVSEASDRANGDDTTKKSSAIAACVGAISHKSPRVRIAAAGCLFELAFSAEPPGPVAGRLLDRLDTEDNEDVRQHLAAAIGKVGVTKAGYTCRVIDRIRNRSEALVDAELVTSLKPFGGMVRAPVTDAAFDFAYELVMADRPGSAGGRAMSILTNPPEGRTKETCPRLAEAVAAGVNHWGHAATELWKLDDCHDRRDLIVTRTLSELKAVESAPNYGAASRQLMDLEFVEDLPTREGVSSEQKKSLCDAAASLAKNAKDADCKKRGEKMVALCEKKESP